MCTAISLRAANGDMVTGRTMDFSYRLSPRFFRIPAGQRLMNQITRQPFYTRYAFMGIGQKLPELQLADGANEAGLSIAALYFPEYVQYDTMGKGQPCVASTDVTTLVLGLCGSVEQAVTLLKNTAIIGMKDAITHSVAPLHWLLADSSGRCVTFEKTRCGAQCHENPVGILANSPDFGWHMTNLRNYMLIAPKQSPSASWGQKITLKPFGQGGGTFSLPGDYTSTGRFVRAAWLAAHTQDIPDGTAAVNAAFHILGNVSIPKGCVVTDRASWDYTQYTVMFDLKAFRCYLKQYDDLPSVQTCSP